MFSDDFGLLGQPDRVVDMLRQLHRVTTTRGVVLATSRDVRETTEEAHLRYHRRNLRSRLPIGLVTIRIAFEGVESDWFELLMCFPEEMASLAPQAGWYLEQVIGPRGLYVGVLKKHH